MKLQIIQFRERADGPSLEFVPKNKRERKLLELFFRNGRVKRSYDGRYMVDWKDDASEEQNG